jgi:DNA-binding IclR family transcriptional regulator
MCHNNQIMPKQIPQSEFNAILEAVSQFPKGVSIKDLIEILWKKLPRRTLQRRLERLVEQKRLVIEDRGHGSCYRFPKITGEAHVTFPNQDLFNKIVVP